MQSMLRTMFSSGPHARALLPAGLLVCLSAVWAGAQQKPGEMPPAPVSVAEVQRRQLKLGETFVGTVVPLRSSIVGSPLEGRVLEFLVNEGDYVTRGQPLARLRTTTLEIELAAAKAELGLRGQELAELELSAPKEIEQAEARMLAAKALMEFAQQRLKRSQQLAQGVPPAIAEDELQQQISAAAAADEVYREKKAAWELAKSGLWDRKIGQAKARVTVQEETIRRLEDDIHEHTVVAPFDGYVTREHTEVGEWITRGGPVAEVVELSSVDVEVPVPERYVSDLRIGTPARVEIDALPGTSRSGKVALIVPEAGIRSRSFPVKVRLKNEPEDCGLGQSGVMLKPGMFGRVTLPVGRIDAALLVPKDALVLGVARPIVWAVETGTTSAVPSKGRVRMVPVELGVAYDEMIEVRGALEAGQWVVVEGNERINPSQPVTVVKTIQPEAGS